MPYSIHLRYSDLETADRAAVEQRFRIRLHCLLGSETQVKEHHRRWIELTSATGGVSDTDKLFLAHWDSVLTECASEAFKHPAIAGQPEPVFEIRVAP